MRNGGSSLTLTFFEYVETLEKLIDAQEIQIKQLEANIKHLETLQYRSHPV